MGKFFVFCRIKLNFCSWLNKKRWHTSWKFQLEITSNKKVIAKKSLTNLYEMNSWLYSRAYEKHLEGKNSLCRHTQLPEIQIWCVKLYSIDTACIISSPNSMFDFLFESSRWDDSNKWSNKGFGEEIGIIEVIICTLSGALSYDRFLQTFTGN